jgi:cation transport regulator ChaC
VTKDEISVFGYGSLVYRPSLLKTVKTASMPIPAYIRGYKRSFSFWDSIGEISTTSDGKVLSNPYYALNISPENSNEGIVSGVLFTVSMSDYRLLLKREWGYDAVRTQVYDFQTRKQISSDAIVFVAKSPKEGFLVDSKFQKQYLNDFISGCQQISHSFYQVSLETTYIMGDRLSDRLNVYAD